MPPPLLQKRCPLGATPPAGFFIGYRLRTALATLGSPATALPAGRAPWGLEVAAATKRTDVGFCLSALPCGILLWRRCSRALRSRGAIRANVAGSPAPLLCRRGYPRPLLLHPSLRSPPPRRSGARESGRGLRPRFFIGSASQPLRGLGGYCPRPRGAGASLLSGRAGRDASLLMVAPHHARRSRRFGMLSAPRGLRSPDGRPQPPFRLVGSRVARSTRSGAFQISGRLGAVALTPRNDLESFPSTTSTE